MLTIKEACVKLVDNRKETVIVNIMKYLIIKLIKIYQKIPGPWHLACRYTPTCSEYAIGCLNKFGFFKGSYLAIKRIIRCNPFHKLSCDPVPEGDIK